MPESSIGVSKFHGQWLNAGMSGRVGGKRFCW
jgi:hypothetical protein